MPTRSLDPDVVAGAIADGLSELHWISDCLFRVQSLMGAFLPLYNQMVDVQQEVVDGSLIQQHSTLEFASKEAVIAHARMDQWSFLRNMRKLKLLRDFLLEVKQLAQIRYNYMREYLSALRSMVWAVHVGDELNV